MKFLAAILYSRGLGVETRLFPELETILGRIDYRGRGYPFTNTDYYEDEMGPELHRMIVSFEPLGSPTGIVDLKLGTAQIEDKFKENGSRRVNIDPGYIDYFKVVLASFKEGPQKIYLGKGVYADPVLLYQSGAFEPLPWSFPDLKQGIYMEDFKAIRAIYREARRAGGPDK
ncbi:MAG: DUF4416 family protein [Candidatus Krumholzibacteria bacterium]|nr:DUF4416 family protein [Candidatus Krumholzibacteria bacterium]